VPQYFFLLLAQQKIFNQNTPLRRPFISWTGGKLAGVSGPGNRMEKIWKECSGEYQDALSVKIEWGSRILLKEGHVEETQRQVIKVSRRVEGLVRWILVQRVSVSKNRHINCHVTSVNCGAVVIREDKPDRRRSEADAPAFSYDAGDVLPLDGCV